MLKFWYEKEKYIYLGFFSRNDFMFIMLFVVLVGNKRYPYNRFKKLEQSKT